MKLFIKILRMFLGYPEEPVHEILDDINPAVNNQREKYAMDQLDTELKFISAELKISRREALCKLMEMNDVDYKERSEVEKFFWFKGVSAENITTLTDEFYSLQNKEFSGEQNG